MSEEKQLQSMDAKIKEILSNPESPMTVYRHVANGGTMTELAKMWGIPYHEVYSMMQSTEKNSTLLSRATIARGEFYVEKVKGLLNDLTNSTIKGLYNDDGKLKPVHEMDDVLAASVASIKSTEYFEGEGRDKAQVGWIKEVKFWDKTKAIEMLAKSLGMFIEKHEHTHKLTLEDLVVASREPKDVIDIDKK